MGSARLPRWLIHINVTCKEIFADSALAQLLRNSVWPVALVHTMMHERLGEAFVILELFGLELVQHSAHRLWFVTPGVQFTLQFRFAVLTPGQ